MSNEAIAFATIPVGEQIRLEDRVSFAYIEYASVVQDRTGVVAYRNTEEEGAQRLLIQLPVSGIAVVMLGPGTSISTPALTSITRSGATVMFTGGGGIPAYSHATPLTSSARWAIAQARLVANEANQRKAAQILYKRQFGLEDFPGGSIKIMRGIEGRKMRDAYRQLGKRYKVKGFKRSPGADDPVNQSLNLANSILYGCAASACAAIGVNASLGIIHRGDARSLLFDLADLYKLSITLPIAFAHHAVEDREVRGSMVRKAVRSELVKRKALREMLQVLMEVLEPYLPSRGDDRLVADKGGVEVVGHRSYADDAQGYEEVSCLPS